MATRVGISGNSSRLYKRNNTTNVVLGGSNRFVTHTQNVVSDSTYIAAIARIIAFFAVNSDWGWVSDPVTTSLDLQTEAVEVPGRTIPLDWGWLT